MRLKPINEPLPLTASVRGRVVLRQTKHGIVAQAWPRRRGSSKKPSETWWRATWGIAAQMAARPYGLDQEFAEAWTAGTPYAPRDYLTMAALGMLFEIEAEDGTPWKSLLKMTGNPQALLDLVTPNPNSWLFRSSNGWIGIQGAQPPGSPAITTVAFATTPPPMSFTSQRSLAWTTATIDTAARWSPTTNPERVTFQPADAGRIAVVNGALRGTGLSNNVRAFLSLDHRNAAGANKRLSTLNFTHPAGTFATNCTLVTDPIEAGDYIEAIAFIVSASNFSINTAGTYMSVVLQ